jgi:hypothetical protein
MQKKRKMTAHIKFNKTKAVWQIINKEIGKPSLNTKKSN